MRPGRLACFFALIGYDRKIHDSCGCQRNDGCGAGNRQTTAWLLRLLLWIHCLVLGRAHPMQTKQTAMLLKDMLDAFGQKNFGERKVFTTKNCVNNFLETATVTAWGIWFRCSHEKTLLGFFQRQVNLKDFRV